MPHRLSIREGHPRGCPSCHLVEDEATILDVHLLAIERVAPDARVLLLGLVPVLHEHEDRTRPDDGGAGLEDGAAPFLMCGWKARRGERRVTAMARAVQ